MCDANLTASLDALEGTIQVWSPDGRLDNLN
jgi:hypothetical protein